jgi:uncharacterized membrane protein YsdA (DUF1294 family)
MNTADNNVYTTFIIYLAVINVVTFIVYGIDKWKAQHNRWRISESSLLTLAAIGGSVGAWIGMQTFHHKTLHNKFRYGVPAILLLQLIVAFYFFG